MAKHFMNIPASQRNANIDPARIFNGTFENGPMSSSMERSNTSRAFPHNLILKIGSLAKKTPDAYKINCYDSVERARAMNSNDLPAAPKR